VSRSIHTTRRHLEELKRTDYADRKLRRAEMRRVRDQLDMKRQIKAQIWQERHRDSTPDSPVAVEAIPIYIHDESEFVHYPAGLDDLRGVMHLLPPGTLDGLSKIVLCLGAEHQRERLKLSGHGYGPDPYVGRISTERLPGVFTGRYLGTYFQESAVISIYGYVYSSDMPDRDVCELYLRLQMLSTFVHEVAHHQDEMTRIARGRWLAEPGEKSEQYARHAEYDWTREAVVCYLEQAYPEAVQALATWMAYHGGVAVPLSALADDPARYVFHASSAFESLIEDVDARKSPRETRLQFARELHYGEYYAEALESITLVLAEHPHDSEALTLQADIYEHQDRYDQAEALVEKVLAHDPEYADAWNVLEDICRARGDWRGVEAAATHAMRLYEPGSWQQRSAIEERICARLEIGDFHGAEEDLEALSQFKGDLNQHTVAVLRTLWLLRTRQYEEALRTAVACIARRRAKLRSLLHAVRFDAAHRLRRPGEAGVLSANDIANLRAGGFADWMNRLQALK
jgi:tetratricopeptide (TPR) repeat protein